MNFWKELTRRWELESPAFFKKIARFGAWLMGVAMIVIIPEIPAEVGVSMPELIPEPVAAIARYVFVIGLVMNRVASLTVNDPSKLEP